MVLKQFNSLERLIFRWELAEPYQIGTCCFVLNTNENLFPKMENPKARKKVEIAAQPPATWLASD